MFEEFIDHFDGEHFPSEEEYNAEVLRFSNYLEGELGRAERWALSGDAEVLNQLGVVIDGVEED